MFLPIKLIAKGIIAASKSKFKLKECGRNEKVHIEYSEVRVNLVCQTSSYTESRKTSK